MINTKNTYNCYFILPSLLRFIISKFVDPTHKSYSFNIEYILFYIDQRRNYKNVFHAFGTIAKNEGITTLWRGSVATMGRAVVVNVSQLATYSQAKFLIASKCNVTI